MRSISHCILLTHISLELFLFLSQKGIIEFRRTTAYLGRQTISLLTIPVGTLSGVDPNKYYFEKDVNQCIADLNTIGLLLLGQGITASLCNLTLADGYIMGDQLTKL